MPAVQCLEEQLVKELRSDCHHFTPLPLKPRSYAEAVTGPPAGLATAKLVYVRHGGMQAGLADKYDGPYTVVDRTDKYFVVLMCEQEEKVTVDRLKPHMGSAAVRPAAVKKQGQPALVKPPLLRSDGSGG
jgi:hypothetical protein